MEAVASDYEDAMSNLVDDFQDFSEKILNFHHQIKVNADCLSSSFLLCLF
jgi:hypothetical protein